MRSILEFNLPEEDYEFACAIAATKLNRSVYDIREYIRRRIKYEDYGITPLEILEEIKEMLPEEIL